MAIHYIDEVFVYQTEDELRDLIIHFQPDVRILGEDYIGKPFTGDYLEIETFYNNRHHPFSSRELKNRVIHWSFEGKIKE